MSKKSPDIAFTDETATRDVSKFVTVLVPSQQQQQTGASDKMSGGGGSSETTSEVTAGRPASVILLDERRLELHIQPRMYAGELLDLVASHCQLREKEFFGLAVVDENGHYQWLQLDRKVSVDANTQS